MPCIIRPETPADFTHIHELVREAFTRAEHSDGDEHFLVDRLRRSAEYIPELSFAAEEKGRIVGQIMFSRLQVGAAKGAALALAPLAVLPGLQGKGIGTALIRHGHAAARALGWEFAVVLGHPAYYARFGYLPAKAFGLTAPFDVPEEAFMALNLKDGPKHLPGMVRYSAAFSLQS